MLTIFALFGVPARGEESTARISLRVENASGRGIAGTRVRLVRGRGEMLVSGGETDASGKLELRFLPPGGDYVLRLEPPGRAAVGSGPIDLDPGRLTLLHVVLPPEGADTAETLVPTTWNVVDTTDPRTASAFGAETIADLAILGRFYPGILTLAPGVTDTDNDGSPNVQGARETGLQHRLDGADVTDPVTGHGGVNLGFEAIEELDVIQAGAGAAYGRADGGFTNILTKSGDNEIHGTLRLSWRNSLLQDDESDALEDTFVRSAPVSEQLDELGATLTVGGPILRDRLWYFVAAHRIDSTATQSYGSADRSTTREGWTTFAKLSWQPAPGHRLSLTALSDPRRYEGLFDSFEGGRESEALWQQGSTTYQARWDWIIRPDLFLETGLARTVSGIEIDPESHLFHEIDVSIQEFTFGGRHLRALFPIRECSKDGTAAGFIPNCDPSQGRTSIHQVDLVNGGVTGPLWFRGDDTRIRGSLRADITFALESGKQEHLFRAGVEGTRESFDDESIYNAFFQNLYSPCPGCTTPGGQPIPNAVFGFNILTVPHPASSAHDADGLNEALHLGDTWKPVPNLSIVAGLRMDRESLEAPGFRPFDPVVEKKRSIAIVEGLCEDAARVAMVSGMSNSPLVCSVQGRVPGTIVNGNLRYTMDPSTPVDLRRFDVNGDGVFDSGVDRIDGQEVWIAEMTSMFERGEDDLDVDNSNWSPRLGLAWDPWSDGRTKLFTTWGRYYDRLSLAVAAHETAPAYVSFTFEPDPFTHQFDPNSVSRPVRAVQALQVDRELRTPHTDVFTLGVERELAVEWALRATYVQRLAWDLLDDGDVNHILCADFDQVFGVDPTLVCPGPVLPNGKISLDEDLFGGVGTRLANGVPDLYVLNPSFTQVLRVENSGSARYRAVTLEAIRRPWRGWQAAVSYTYSRAEGDGLAFGSAGDDPAAPGDSALDFDQRHRVVLYGTVALPRRVDLGWLVRWESGTPYSITETVADEDNAGNVTTRTVYPTGERNDQRNGAFWSVDARLAKRISLGRIAASLEVAVQNLFDERATMIAGVDPSFSNAPALIPGPEGLSQPGRTWEAGVVIGY